MTLSQSIKELTGETSLCWLSPEGTGAKPGRSRRGAELRKSQARSHIAKLQHRHRKYEADMVEMSTLLANSIYIDDAQMGPGRLTQHTDVYQRIDQFHSSKVFASSTVVEIDGDSGQKIKSDSSNTIHIGTTTTLASVRSCNNVAFQTTRPEYVDSVAAANVNVQTQVSLTVQRINPWTSLSPKLRNSDTLRLYEFGCDVLWPGFEVGKELASRSSVFVNRFASDMFQFEVSQTSPLQFHISMWTCAVFMSHYQRRPIIDFESIKHRQMALKYISSDIERCAGGNEANLQESTLRAIACLGGREFSSTTDAADMIRNPVFRQPFSTLQWLNVYGQRPWLEVHWTTTKRLVAAKGGIDCLMMPGFVGGVQFSDVIHSTLDLSHPHFPLSKIFKRFAAWYDCYSSVDDKDGCSTYYPALMSASCNAALAAMLELKNHGLTNELFDVFEAMRFWCMRLETFDSSKNPPTRAELANLGLYRNILQHKLLSAIPKATSAHKDSTTNLYGSGDMPYIITSITRQVLLIFSLGVTFPISNRRTWTMSVSQLKSVLAPCSYDNFGGFLAAGLHSFLTWVCFIGAMGAMQVEDAESHDWFVGILENVERDRMVNIPMCNQDSPARASYSLFTSNNFWKIYPQTWAEVRDVCLLPHVWHSGACDTSGRDIWDEVLRRLKDH